MMIFFFLYTALLIIINNSAIWKKNQKIYNKINFTIISIINSSNKMIGTYSYIYDNMFNYIFLEGIQNILCYCPSTKSSVSFRLGLHLFLLSSFFYIRSYTLLPRFFVLHVSLIIHTRFQKIEMGKLLP